MEGIRRVKYRQSDCGSQSEFRPRHLLTGARSADISLCPANNFLRGRPTATIPLVRRRVALLELTRSLVLRFTKGRMVRFGAIVRFLMLVVCLVPFTSTRQVEIALAPYVPLAPVLPVSEAPSPVNEEDDERETDGKERLAAQAKHRPPVREQIGSLPGPHTAHPSHPSPVRTTPPVAADPFRNGLGSPYRC